LSQPGIVLVFPNDEGTITADGNHRIVRRFRDGLRTMDFYFVHWRLWRQFQLDAPHWLTKQMAEG
jgi:hypothetical protein